MAIEFDPLNCLFYSWFPGTSEAFHLLLRVVSSLQEPSSIPREFDCNPGQFRAKFHWHLMGGVVVCQLCLLIPSNVYQPFTGHCPTVPLRKHVKTSRQDPDLGRGYSLTHLESMLLSPDNPFVKISYSN